jgi:hypothetical protein
MFRKIKGLEPFRAVEMPNLRECIKPASWLPGFLVMGTMAYVVLRSTAYSQVTPLNVALLPLTILWAMAFAANGGFLTQGLYQELTRPRPSKVVPFDTTNAA